MRNIMKKVSKFLLDQRIWSKVVLTFFGFTMSIYFLVGIAPKIIKTSGDLFILRDNAMFFEEQKQTDKIHDEYLKNQVERNKIYNSPDPVINRYANSFILWKIIFPLVCLGSYIVLPLCWASRIAVCLLPFVAD